MEISELLGSVRVGGSGAAFFREVGVVRQVLAEGRPGGVVLLHDSDVAEQGAELVVEANELAVKEDELVAAYTWNEGLARLKEQGVPVKFMKPKEGILTWVCGIMRGAGGPGDEDQVYDWINAMTSPDAGRFLIDAYGYGHANRMAIDLVSKERLADLGISSPEETLANSVFFKAQDPELEDEYSRRFEKAKTAL